MCRALDELVIAGVETCAPYHRRVMEEKDFREGALSIRYVEEHPALLTDGTPEEVVVAAAVATALLEEEHRMRRAPRIEGGGGRPLSAWRAASSPRGAGP
jgi:acetyl/propionyl-CoA carboxylase alpha subunit